MSYKIVYSSTPNDIYNCSSPKIAVKHKILDQKNPFLSSNSINKTPNSNINNSQKFLCRQNALISEFRRQKSAPLLRDNFKTTLSIISSSDKNPLKIAFENNFKPINKISAPINLYKYFYHLGKKFFFET